MFYYYIVSWIKEVLGVTRCPQREVSVEKYIKKMLKYVVSIPESSEISNKQHMSC